MVILDHLRRWAAHLPNKTCLQTTNDTITYFELYNRVCTMATLLKAYINRPVLLLFHPRDVISFTVAFHACLMAGAIAVPVGTNYRLIQNDCKAPAIITSWSLYFTIRWTDWSTSIIVEGGWGCRVRCCPQSKELTDEERIVLLQYTSGSTCNPRGVMISHRALSANVQWVSSQYLGNKTNLVSVTWVPFYHDYGLTSILNCLYTGGKMVYMSPMEFLKDPLQWLRVMTKEKATHTQAPNFAYALCARRARLFPHKAEGIDLRSVRQFSMGGETIRKDTIEAFTTTFSVTAAQMDPSYGLAECVCGIVHFQDPHHSHAMAVNCFGQDVVTVGKIGDHVEIDILPDERFRVGGELLVHGKTMMSGYYNKNPNEGFHVIQGKKWVKTGDIGYIDDEGYLYITGRSKDVIVVNGKNIIATDVEHIIATAFPDLRPGSIAAVPIQKNDTEHLGVIAEVRNTNSIPDIKDIRSVVYAALEVSVSRILLVPKKTLPKTTSGKLQRFKCRSYFY